MRIERACALLLSCCVTAAAMAAEDDASRRPERFEPARPFVFSITTAKAGAPRVTVDYESGYAAESGTPFGYDGLEQRFGGHVALGRGFTLLGQLGIGFGARYDAKSLQQAELLKDLIGVGGGLRLALGLGARREWDGTKTALARAVLERSSVGSIVTANLRFERPFAADRDELDVVTSLGWLKRMGRPVAVGVEVVGEDLEGLWDDEEAEGGARVYLGPSVHVTSLSERLGLTLCGGPIVRITRSGGVSAAPRDLDGKRGYTLRLSASYSF